MTIADPEQLREPPYGARRGLARLGAELLDHLWPWDFAPQQDAPRFALAALLIGMLVIAWSMTFQGLVGSRTMALGWTPWSLVESGIRLHTKPYVKDGPWWGLTYRTAGWVDMLSYVGLKNILIANAMLAALGDPVS